MKLSFDITIDDVVAFHSYHFDAALAAGRKKRISSYGFAALVLSVLGIVCYLDFKSPVYLAIYGVMAVITMAVGVTGWSAKSSMLKRVRRQAENKENANLFGAYTMEFDDGKVRIAGGKSEETLQWAAFVRFIEAPEYFFPYLSAQQALIVPKRAMTEAEVGGLRELLNSKIKN